MTSITQIFSKIVLFFMLFSLASCGNSYYRKLSKDDPRNLHYKGHYKIGNEYSVKGKTYKPEQVTRYNKVGVASWYGSRDGFHGKKTANGDTYNKHLLTAAHKTLPLPSLVKVTNLHNNKSLIVMVNDRGPFVDGREIDVSEKAASILGFRNQGTAKVRVQYLHSDTQQFLGKLGLQKKHGSRASKLASNKERCSVNCQIKLVNLKHKNKSGTF